MGYHTLFFGEFHFQTPLKPEHAGFLQRFSQTRRMKRLESLLLYEPDPWRSAAGLPIGLEGAYFVGSREPFGQDYDHLSVLDTDEPPLGQPGLWCHWAPARDGKTLAWNGNEKFYHYDEWLEYLVEHFLDPWGYVLEGTMRWIGEDPQDQGTIYMADNEVFVLPDETIEELLADLTPALTRHHSPTERESGEQR
jgi:hypothetical protein